MDGIQDFQLGSMLGCFDLSQCFVQRLFGNIDKTRGIAGACFIPLESYCGSAMRVEVLEERNSWTINL